MAAKLSDYLKIMVERKASDIYLSVGAPVNIRIEGISTPIDDFTLNAESVRAIASRLASSSNGRIFSSVYRPPETRFRHGLPIPHIFPCNIVNENYLH